MKLERGASVLSVGEITAWPDAPSMVNGTVTIRNVDEIDNVVTVEVTVDISAGASFESVQQALCQKAVAQISQAAAEWADPAI